MDSYRSIIDASDPASTSGRPIAVETFDRMLQAATCGANLLESVISPQKSPPAEVARSPKRKEPEETKDDPTVTAGPSAAKRQVVLNCFLLTLIYICSRRWMKLLTPMGRNAKAAMQRLRQNGAEAHWVRILGPPICALKMTFAY